MKSVRRMKGKLELEINKLCLEVVQIETMAEFHEIGRARFEESPISQNDSKF